MLRLGLRFSLQGDVIGDVLIAVSGAALVTRPRLADLIHARGALKERIVEAEVELVAELGRAASSVRELLELTAGSLLRLDGAPGDHVTLRVDDVAVARGNPVVRKGDLAIHVCELIRKGGRPMSDPSSDPAEVLREPPRANTPRESDIDRILDIPLEVHVELGRRRMRISELLEVEIGTVVELGTAAGVPLSIFANSVFVAQGEAVIVGERYGIRITDIVPAGERVRRLGGREAA